MSLPDIRGSLVRSPWWVLSLVTGTGFGLAEFVLNLGNSRSGTDSVITAALAGLFFGLLMGPITSQRNQRYLAAVGDLSPAEQRQARRAVTRGRVPTDPEVRAAASRILTQRLASSRQRREPSILVLFLAVYVGLAFANNAWWALGAVLCTGLLGFSLWTRRCLRQRQPVLAEGYAEPGGPVGSGPPGT